MEAIATTICRRRWPPAVWLQSPTVWRRTSPRPPCGRRPVNRVQMKWVVGYDPVKTAANGDATDGPSPQSLCAARSNKIPGLSTAQAHQAIGRRVAARNVSEGRRARLQGSPREGPESAP
jgi:hypothetical protein